MVNKNSNSTKKFLIPYYIRKIIMERTSSEGKHITQKEIVDILRDEYGVEIDRRSVSRIVNALADSGYGILSVRGSNTWYDPRYKWTKDLYF